jgi:hypothetical protein
MNNLKWAQDFYDCTAGTHGPDAKDAANEFIAAHWDMPEGGPFWQAWRDYRLTWTSDREPPLMPGGFRPEQVVEP